VALSVRKMHLIRKIFFFFLVRKGPWTFPYNLLYFTGQYRHLPDFLAILAIQACTQTDLSTDNLCFDREQASTRNFKMDKKKCKN